MSWKVVSGTSCKWRGGSSYGKWRAFISSALWQANTSSYKPEIDPGESWRCLVAVCMSVRYDVCVADQGSTAADADRRATAAVALGGATAVKYRPYRDDLRKARERPIAKARENITLSGFGSPSHGRGFNVECFSIGVQRSHSRLASAGSRVRSHASAAATLSDVPAQRRAPAIVLSSSGPCSSTGAAASRNE
jgi:hypothetical protein